jgi:putative transposase
MQTGPISCRYRTLTYVPTCQGWQYLAFVIHVYVRLIECWRQSSFMRTAFVLGAQEQALHYRQPERIEASIHPSDSGSYYIFIRYSERLVEAGIEPSVGSKGESDDHRPRPSTDCTRPN